jgi:hypothetical protein
LVETSCGPGISGADVTELTHVCVVNRGAIAWDVETSVAGFWIVTESDDKTAAFRYDVCRDVRSVDADRRDAIEHACDGSSA